MRTMCLYHLCEYTFCMISNTVLSHHPLKKIFFIDDKPRAVVHCVLKDWYLRPEVHTLADDILPKIRRLQDMCSLQHIIIFSFITRRHKGIVS